MDSISTSARVSSKTFISKRLAGTLQEGKNADARRSFTPDSTPPVQETGDSEQVLTLPPNRTAIASRADFGGNCRPLSPCGPKLPGTARLATHGRRASTKKSQNSKWDRFAPPGFGSLP